MQTAGCSGPVLQPQCDDGSVPRLPTGQRNSPALPEEQRLYAAFFYGLPKLVMLGLPSEGGPGANAIGV